MKNKRELERQAHRVELASGNNYSTAFDGCVSRDFACMDLYLAGAIELRCYQHSFRFNPHASHTVKLEGEME